jgi:hypothetical protein
VESKSPYVARLFFIKKKDGKLRLVQDYRNLNDHMIKNRYPLPLIPDLIAAIWHAALFTKFDVWWGYNNIWIKKGDKWKAAFITPFGLYKQPCTTEIPVIGCSGLVRSPCFVCLCSFREEDVYDTIRGRHSSSSLLGMSVSPYALGRGIAPPISVLVALVCASDGG